MRALFFLYAIHRYHVPQRTEASGRTLIPYSAYTNLLRRRFQEWFGASIVEEINHRRMRRAAHRLLMGFSAGEVAEFSGIADPAQFSRSFKKTMGKSPKEFQKTYRPGALSKQTR